MIRAIIEAVGDDEWDILVAIDEAKRLISEGCTSGFDRNDTGKYGFDVDLDNKDPYLSRRY